MGDFKIDTRRVELAIFSPDRESVVFGDDEGIIRVWNVDAGKQDGESLDGHTNNVEYLSFSCDGKYLASGSADTTILMWDVDKRKAKTRPLRKHARDVTAVEFSPCGANVVSGSSDRTILVWNAFAGKVLREIICEDVVFSVAYSPVVLVSCPGVLMRPGSGTLHGAWKKHSRHLKNKE